MSKLPFVIIFDIDLTLIGKIRDCIEEANILDMIFSNCKSKNITIDCNKINFNIENELKNGLLRPNLKDFVDFCNKKYKNVELFICTNSTHGWTNGGLVKNIEKVSGITFNKPYFTRDYTLISQEKGISIAYNDILKNLKHKYPILSKSNKYIEKVFQNRIIIIDDIPNNYDNLNSKQIVCPKYNFNPYYDIIDKICNIYKIDIKYINTPQILEYCYNNYIPFFTENGNEYQKDKSYISLQNILYLQEAKIENSKINDTFFLDLIKAMKNKNIMSDNNIKKINDKINILE